MPVPGSGQISLNDFHVEAGGSSGTQCSLNDADIRGLISKGSGVQMAFNEWYGASGQDNLAVISTGTYSVTTTGKFGTTTGYQGYCRSNSAVVSGVSIGSASDVGFSLPNGATFDLTCLIGQYSGMLPSNYIEISGNYGGVTLQSATGYRYLKSGSTILIDSTHYIIGGATANGTYNASTNTTYWYYYIINGTAGYSQSAIIYNSPNGTSMSLYFSN